MSYGDLPLAPFLDGLAAPSPEPGLGTAAGLTAACAAAILEMAVAATPDWPGPRDVVARASAIRSELLTTIDTNAGLHTLALAAKHGEGDVVTAGQALRAAADGLLEIVATATAVAEMAAEALDDVRADERADLAGAVALAEGAAQAAAHLVVINLGLTGTEDRTRRAAALTARARAARAACVDG